MLFTLNINVQHAAVIHESLTTHIGVIKLYVHRIDRI